MADNPPAAGAAFDQGLAALVREAIAWLSIEGYLHAHPTDADALVALSERGAVLMGVVPKALLGE